MFKVKLNLRKVVAIAICLAGVTFFSGCDKEEITEIAQGEITENDDEFCLYANLEDFYKTAPFINNYLDALPNNMSDEQKLQALTDWLNSQPCVINAKLEGVWTDKDCMIECQPGRYGRIAILLDDDGMTRELTLNIFGEYSEPLLALDYSYKKPKEVGVYYSDAYTFENKITIRDVFEFINLFDHKVLNIHKLGSEGYISSMPKDSLDYIVSDLNAKPYFSRVHGYWKEGQLIINVTMSNMESIDYQADWFKTMNDYKLTEVTTIYSWFIIDFEVPDGKEKEWMEKFKTHKFVNGVASNYGYQSMLIQ